LRGIARTEEVGFSPIKTNTVAIRNFSDDEVLAFVALTFNKPFQVRFIELMPLGQAKLDYGEDYIPAAQLIERISKNFELEQIKNERNKTDCPAKIYKINGGLGEIGFINPVSDHFCSTCDRLRLTSDGKLRVCLLKETEIDLRKALRENCSDTELEKLIGDAILLKPEQHDLVCTENSLRKCYRNMSEIGG
jgi:GTP 3',8-cyclase